jgi:hypothetical protein
MPIQYVELIDGNPAMIVDHKDGSKVFIHRNPDNKLLRNFLESNFKAIRNRCVYADGVEILASDKVAPLVKSKIATLSNGLKVHSPAIWRSNLVALGLMCKEPSCLKMLGPTNKSGYCKNHIEQSPSRKNRLNYYQRLQQENLADYLKSQNPLIDNLLLEKLTLGDIDQMIELFGGDKVDIAIQLAILANPVYKQEIKLNESVISKIVQIITDKHFNKMGNMWNPIAIKDSWFKLQNTAHQWMDDAGLSEWKRRQILDRIKQIYLPIDFTP